MAELRRSRGPRALVLGCTVLLLAIAAQALAAQAAKTRCRNCVRSKHIKDGEVKSEDLAAGAVSGEKIQNGAVSTSRLAAGAVSKDKLGSDVRALGLTGVVALPSGAFSMDRENGCQFNGEGNWVGNGIDTCCIHAGVSVPHGATITGFEATLFDNDPAAQMEIDLRRQDLRDGSNSVQLGQLFSQDDPAVQVASGSAVHHLVDAVHYGYFFSLCLPGSEVLFYGARVLFE